MNRIVFLLEERSMAILLERLLPRLFPNMQFRCVPHEGKKDLQRSIPRKLRAWGEPGVRFVVVCDNDGGDCIALKESLKNLCKQGNREDTLIRIVCQELEAWYFGEPDALADAYNDESLRNIGRRSRFREPDRIQKPSAQLRQIAPQFQKISGARSMAAHLSKERNRSTSFHTFLTGIERLIAEDLQGV